MLRLSPHHLRLCGPLTRSSLGEVSIFRAMAFAMWPLPIWLPSRPSPFASGLSLSPKLWVSVGPTECPRGVPPTSPSQARVSRELRPRPCKPYGMPRGAPFGRWSCRNLCNAPAKQITCSRVNKKILEEKISSCVHQLVAKGLGCSLNYSE